MGNRHSYSILLPEDIQQHVLAEVSEKTGYPVEMLDLDLDLEADLGIDTVKQAELFAAIRTHYGIPRREDLILADYNTLARVVAFVEENLGAQNKALIDEVNPEAADSTEPAVPSPVGSENLAAQANAGLAFRAPTLVMIPKVELCSSTQVHLAEREVVIVANSAKISSALSKKLKALHALPVVADPISAVEKIDQLAKAGNLAGVYYLTALDEKINWKALTPEMWVQQRAQSLNPLFELAKVLPESAFLIGATAMGGLLGLLNSENPLGGLISGFIKALQHERPGQLIKVIDFPSAGKGANIADALIKETLHDPVTTEIGYDDGSRYAVSLREIQPEGVTQATLPRNSVFVVSGATGGITGSVLLDLARATQGSFFLLGRTPLPSQDDQDLHKVKADRNTYRVELQKRLHEKGEKATPVQLDQRVMAVERAAAMLEGMEAIRASGGRANYIVCDVTDQRSIEAAVQEIERAADHIDYFIHAAGVEKSRKIETKTSAEFEQTISVKADGFYFLLSTLEKGKLQIGRASCRERV